MYKILSLFSNVGIGEFLIPQGFQVVLANELEEKRCQVYREIYPTHEIIDGDIKEKKELIIEKSKSLGVDIVIATPPCQSFSVINNKKQDSDPRDLLISYAVEIVKSIQPKLAIFENVTKQRDLCLDGLKYLDWIQKILPNYVVWTEILDTQNFGVPQRRKRLFTFIAKKHFKLIPNMKKITLRDAIGHLPSIEANTICNNDRMHFGPKNSEHHILWARHTPSGKSAFENEGKNEFYPKVLDKDSPNGERRIRGYNTTYRRMHWDEVSYTLTMNHAGPNGSNTLHPGRLLPDGTYSDARTLTLREAAIVMGLPDSFNFPKWVSYRDGMKFLGEGLSPVMLREILTAWSKS